MVFRLSISETSKFFFLPRVVENTETTFGASTIFLPPQPIILDTMRKFQIAMNNTTINFYQW